MSLSFGDKATDQIFNLTFSRKVPREIQNSRGPEFPRIPQNSPEFPRIPPIPGAQFPGPVPPDYVPPDSEFPGPEFPRPVPPDSAIPGAQFPGPVPPDSRIPEACPSRFQFPGPVPPDSPSRFQFPGPVPPDSLPIPSRFGSNSRNSRGLSLPICEVCAELGTGPARSASEFEGQALRNSLEGQALRNSSEGQALRNS